MDFLFEKIYLNFKKSYFSSTFGKLRSIYEKMQLFALVDKE